MTRTLVGLPSPVVTIGQETDATDDVLWTPIYPDVLLYHKGKFLWKNVSTTPEASGSEKDFTPWLTGNQTIWQMSASVDNDRYAFGLLQSGLLSLPVTGKTTELPDATSIWQLFRPHRR
jgi:hypothetical protein